MNYSISVQDMLDDWLASSRDQQVTSKKVLNFLVEYLTDDTYWVIQNVSLEAKEDLIKLAEKLKAA